MIEQTVRTMKQPHSSRYFAENDCILFSASDALIATADRRQTHLGKAPGYRGRRLTVGYDVDHIRKPEMPLTYLNQKANPCKMSD